MLGNEVKLMFMFRDPVLWLNSLHNDRHHLKARVEKRGRGIETFIEKGYDCFADTIKGWLESFHRENILFLRSEDYFNNPQATLDQVFKFIDVPNRTYTAEELSAASYQGRRRTSSRSYAKKVARSFSSTERS